MRRLVAAVAAYFAMGCYVAAPLTGARPVTGTRVAIGLTESGTTSMASQLGPGRVRLVGNVAAATDSSLVLAVRTVTDRRGIEETWTGEQVTVPTSAMATVAEQRVSVGRSVGLALAIAAVAALAGALASSGGSSSGPPVDGGAQ